MLGLLYGVAALVVGVYLWGVFHLGEGLG